MSQKDKKKKNLLLISAFFCILGCSTKMAHGFALSRIIWVTLGHLLATVQTYKHTKDLKESVRSVSHKQIENDSQEKNDSSADSKESVRSVSHEQLENDSQEKNDNSAVKQYRYYVTEGKKEGLVEYWLKVASNTEPIEKALHGVLELLEEQKNNQQRKK
jgi:flagellar biosynthesis component FlhA